MALPIRRYCIGYIVAIYSILLLTFRHYDSVVFDEMTRWVAKWKELSYSRLLTAEELERAYNLPENLRNKESNVILLWGAMFGEVNPIGAPENGCVLTYDRSAMAYAKAVVFHFAEIHDSTLLLPLAERKSWQRWIWWCLESPSNTRFVFHKSLTPLNGVFNWTMTYRLDSDIVQSYQDQTPRTVNSTLDELLAEKTAIPLGIWMVSNCKASLRMNFVKELQKYVDIDVRGKCTGKPLCRGQCALDTIKTYKFYFSFENSRCKDYITEKFYDLGLQGGAVPIVMGPTRGDYEKTAPPNSFIHVDDFKTVKELADYMMELDKDDNKYKEYLRWRSIPDGSSIAYSPKLTSNWETLCEKIKNEDTESKTMNNLDTFWYGKGYSPSSTRFSICHLNDGPTGRDLHKFLVLGYTLTLIICCLVTIKYCTSKTKSRKL